MSQSPPAISGTLSLLTVFVIFAADLIKITINHDIVYNKDSIWAVEVFSKTFLAGSENVCLHPSASLLHPTFSSAVFKKETIYP